MSDSRRTDPGRAADADATVAGRYLAPVGDMDAEDELEADRPGDKFNALFEGENARGKCALGR